MCKSLKLYKDEIFIVSLDKEYSLAGLLRLAAEISGSGKKLHENPDNATERVLTKSSLMSERPQSRPFNL